MLGEMWSWVYGWMEEGHRRQAGVAGPIHLLCKGRLSPQSYTGLGLLEVPHSLTGLWPPPTASAHEAQLQQAGRINTLGLSHMARFTSTNNSFCSETSPASKTRNGFNVMSQQRSFPLNECVKDRAMATF